MTRDIFSTAACASAVSEYHSSQELHLTAMPTPLRAREIKTRNQSTGTTRDVVMGPQLRSVAKCKPEGTAVQQRSRVSVAAAKRLIEALDEPWSSTKVARAYQVSEETAYEWLARCAAKFGWVADRGRNGGFRRQA